MASRRTTTLIELMVVISIIGMLGALLLPSVQHAATSRSQYVPKQFATNGFGAAKFQSAHQHFPMGARGRFDIKLAPQVMYDLSWWTNTIGLMGESAVADELDREGPNVGWVSLNTHNGDVVDDFAPEFFFCPSSPVEQTWKVGNYQRIAMPSYAGIWAVRSHDGFGESRVNRCCRSEGEISGGGELIPNAVVSLQQISDGLSRTLIVGEQSDFAYKNSGERMHVGAAFYPGWLTGSNHLGTPPDYTNSLAPSFNVVTVRYRLNEHRYELPGIIKDGGATILCSLPTRES